MFSRSTQLILLFACSIWLVSCQKEYSIEGAGNNAANTDYYPSTTGTYWTYQDATDSTATFTMTVQANDTTIGTSSYRIIRSDNSSFFPDILLRKTPGLYFSKGGGIAGLLGAAISNPVLDQDQIILKDNVAVGSSWNTSFNIDTLGFTVTVNIVNTITEKAVPRTVNNISFNDVIGVQTKVSIQIPLLGNQDILSINNYYAKGVGPVEITVNDAIQGNSFSYVVKNYQVR